MIKAVVFDFDGTLVDSDDAIVKAVRAVFRDHSYPVPSRGTVLKYVGFSITGWLAAVLKEQKVRGANAVKLGQEALVYVRKFFAEHGGLMPGCKQALSQLRKRGLLLVIISNTSHRNLYAALEKLGLLKYFDQVVSCEEMPVPKPHPSSLRRLLANHGLKKTECLYVGDSMVDHQYAKSAGVKLALLSLRRNRSVPRDYSLRRLTDIMEIIE